MKAYFAPKAEWLTVSTADVITASATARIFGEIEGGVCENLDVDEMALR